MSAVPKLTLSAARGLLAWTQARLAEEAGVKTTAISDIESGRTQNPGYATVMRIVRALQSGGLQGLKSEDVFPIPAGDTEAARAS